MSERLRALIYPESAPPDELLVAGPVGRVSFAEAQELDFREARPGERLGPLWSTYWFRVRATVPAVPLAQTTFESTTLTPRSRAFVQLRA